MLPVRLGSLEFLLCKEAEYHSNKTNLNSPASSIIYCASKTFKGRIRYHYQGLPESVYCNSAKYRFPTRAWWF